MGTVFVSPSSTMLTCMFPRIVEEPLLERFDVEVGPLVRTALTCTMKSSPEYIIWLFTGGLSRCSFSVTYSMNIKTLGTAMASPLSVWNQPRNATDWISISRCGCGS